MINATDYTANHQQPASSAHAQPDVRFEMKTVTPAYAKYLLDHHNTHNRPLSQGAVTAYAHDMTNGKWHPSNDAITLSVDEALLNGQHRLAAVVKSGITIPMLFGYNFPTEAQETMDAGRKRTFANTLSLRGEAHTVGLAAVARRVWAWENGERAEPRRETPSGSQLSEVIERHPSLRTSAAIAKGIKLPIEPSTLGLCHWLFSAIDPAGCRFFFGRLGDGANLDVDHPVIVLRRTLIDQRTAKSTLRKEVATAYVIKAWNAYRAGRSINVLRIRLGGDKPESFPEPQ